MSRAAEFAVGIRKICWSARVVYQQAGGADMVDVIDLDFQVVDGARAKRGKTSHPWCAGEAAEAFVRAELASGDERLAIFGPEGVGGGDADRRLAFDGDLNHLGRAVMERAGDGAADVFFDLKGRARLPELPTSHQCRSRARPEGCGCRLRLRSPQAIPEAAAARHRPARRRSWWRAA